MEHRTLTTNIPARVRRIAWCAWLLGIFATASAAAQDFSQVEIRAEPLRGGLHVMYGAGGNMVLSAGDDGLVLVDDQYAPLAPKISAAIGRIQSGAVDYVINTHWHGDHVGGNEAFATAGATILAHENVWRRMASEQYMAAFDRRVPAAPAPALPVVTHDDGMTLRFNGQTIRIYATAPAHTDGDSLVHFVEADVLHMGDTFVTTGLPFLDLSSGGSIDGMLRTIEKGIAIAGNATIVVPGHGTLSERHDLIAYHEMLITLRARVAAGVERGDDLQTIVDSKPTRGYEAIAASGFVKGPQVIGAIYQSLLQTRGAR